jgi:Tol biopolymer transport system component
MSAAVHCDIATGRHCEGAQRLNWLERSCARLLQPSVHLGRNGSARSRDERRGLDGLSLVILGVAVALVVGPSAASGARTQADGWIAYDERVYFRGGDAWQILVVHPDYGRKRSVTPGGMTDNTEAAWSPDRRRIAFVGETLVKGVASGIFVVNSDGSSPRRLTAPKDSGAHREGGPAWSPDGRLIAYPLRGSIWTMAADGSNRRRLTRGKTDGNPAWSPDGTRIAFTRGPERRRGGKTRGSHIWLITPGGGRPWHYLAGATHPSWSPDSQKLAYEGTRGIFVINRNRTGRRFLRSGSHPSWSPDGRRIAFIDNSRVNRPAIAVMDANGKNHRRVIKAYHETGSPTWSSG